MHLRQAGAARGFLAIERDRSSADAVGIIALDDGGNSPLHNAHNVPLPAMGSPLRLLLPM